MFVANGRFVEVADGTWVAYCQGYKAEVLARQFAAAPEALRLLRELIDSYEDNARVVREASLFLEGINK